MVSGTLTAADGVGRQDDCADEQDDKREKQLLSVGNSEAVVHAAVFVRWIAHHLTPCLLRVDLKRTTHGCAWSVNAMDGSALSRSPTVRARPYFTRIVSASRRCASVPLASTRNFWGSSRSMRG